VLTGSQATAERRRNDGEERRWLELGARAEEGESELESKEERCGVLRGCSSPFIGARGASGRRQREATGGG
jgi:hypothetical protein